MATCKFSNGDAWERRSNSEIVVRQIEIMTHRANELTILCCVKECYYFDLKVLLVSINSDGDIPTWHLKYLPNADCVGKLRLCDTS